MEEKINNKVEILRAICFDENDMGEIKDFPIQFTDKEIEFMVEFKKIYELGVNQLYKFIDKLLEEGNELDVYSITYYVDVLNVGPFSKFIPSYLETKDNVKYFDSYPDSLGQNGNVSITTSSSLYFVGDPLPLGTTVDIYNKLPKVSQETLKESVLSVEDVFRKNMYCAVVMDNTLPLSDKKPQERYESEKEWTSKPNGSLAVKDFEFYTSVKKSSPEIFNKIKNNIGEENNRILVFNKSLNPFSSEDHVSVGGRFEVKREYSQGNEKIEEVYDLDGELYDSDERRKTSLKIETFAKTKEYKLNTNEGQLGT